MSVTPLRNVPLPRIVSDVLEDVRGELSACRRAWWAMGGTVCLAGKWALREPPAITMLTGRRQGAVQIKDADYDQEEGRLRILFRDGVALVIQAGDGVEA